MKVMNLVLIGGALVAALTGCSKNTQKAPAALSVAKADHIIGGQEVTGEEEFASHVVALYDSKQGGLCTASIISDEFLVTAAHCIGEKTEDMVVMFGLNVDALISGQDPDNKLGVQGRRVIGMMQHPGYAEHQNDDLNNDDIAIVMFEGGLPEGYTPVQLLADREYLQNGNDLVLAGYGIDDGVKSTGSGILRYVTTTLLDAMLSDTEILIDQSQGRGACHGDSGGPAYIVTDDGVHVLVGVTSRGWQDVKDHCDVAAVYTAIPAYYDWMMGAALDLIHQQEINGGEVPFPVTRAPLKMTASDNR